MESRKAENMNIGYALGLFALSVVIRFFLADYVKYITVMPDELRYYAIAESIATGRGINVFGCDLGYQKILYCLVIAPAFWLKSRILQQHAIAFISSIWVSLGIFPIYFFAKELRLKKHATLIVLISYMLCSDLCFSLMYMSEIIYLPLSIISCFLLFKINALAFEVNGIRKLFSFLTGVIIYLTYFAKEVAVAFVCAEILYLIGLCIEALLGKKNKDKHERKLVIRQTAIMAGLVCVGFICGFVIVKWTLFRGLGNSYSQQGIDILFEEGRLQYLFYSAIYYFINVIIAVFGFPLLLPLSLFNKLSTKQKLLVKYLIYVLVVITAVVAYTISVREDFGRISPRAHLRYVGFAAPILMIVFMSVVENLQVFSSGNKIAYAIFCLLLFLALVLYRGAFSYAVDQTTLNYLLNLDEYKLWVFRFAFAIICALVGINYFSNSRNMIWIFLVIVAIVQIKNNQLAIDAFKINAVTEDEINDTAVLEDYIVDDLANDNVLFVIGDEFSRKGDIACTFFNHPNVSFTSGKILIEQQIDASGINLNEELIRIPLWGYQYKDFITADYVVFPNELTVYDEPNLVFSNDGYSVYEVKNNILPYFEE